MKHPLRQFGDDTRATGNAVGRVEARLTPQFAEPARVRSRLAAVPTASTAAATRVLARLRTRSHVAPSHRRPLLLGTLLAAAVMLWTVQPAPAPLNAALSATTWQTVNPTEQVALTFLGDGTLSGSTTTPRIEWRAGTLRAEVQPNQGVQLSVRTREATVHVLGTGFSVERGALGTTVRVSHGRVSVICDAGEAAVLGAGSQQVCAPTTSAALLGRARALSALGAPPEDVLGAVELGLGAGPTVPVREELQVARTESLGALGRWDEAYQVATTALGENPTARRQDLLHLQARAAGATQGCPAAAPLWGSLFQDGQASPPELVALADCVGPTDPALARRALEKAIELGVPESERAGVDARLEGLRP